MTKKGKLAMGAMSLDQITQIIVPDVFRQENRMPFGAMTVFLQEDSGWVNTPQGQGPMPEPQHRTGDNTMGLYNEVWFSGYLYTNGRWRLPGTQLSLPVELRLGQGYYYQHRGTGFWWQAQEP